MYGTIKRIKRDFQKKPESIPDLDNLWIWGKTGLGKTRKARALAGDDYYIKNANKWFCGYQGEHTVIIDDFDIKHNCLAYYLKNWADHNAFQAETKGDSLMIRPKRFIVTSNYDIRTIFPEEENYGPLERRFKQIHYRRPTGTPRQALLMDQILKIPREVVIVPYPTTIFDKRRQSTYNIA